MTNNRSKEKAISTLQEVLWLLESLSPKQTKEIIMQLDEMRKYSSHGLFYPGEELLSLKKYTSQNEGKNFLVGVLPKFLQDQSVFPENKDVAGFAKEIFDIYIKYEKKSRFEVIGTIVCYISEADDRKFEKVVELIAKVVTDESKVQKLSLERERVGFSWNDAIRRLSRDQ